MIQVKREADVTQAMLYALDLGAFTHSTNLPYFQIIADYLRELLYTLSTSSEGVSEPVFTTRLLNQARRHLYHILPSDIQSNSMDLFFSTNEENDEDPFRQTLNLLNDIRDIATIGEGYWLPTPVRFIQPLNNESKHILIVGGLPTKELKTQIHSRICLNGLTRTIQRQFIPKDLVNDTAKWQTFDDWLGSPPNDLKFWTTEYFDQSRSNFLSSGSEVKEFDVYVPQFNNSKLQYYRWHRSSEIHALHDKIFLCRSAKQNRIYGPVFYWLGTVKEKDGDVVMDKEFTIPPRDVRRLQYGIDLLENRPTVAILESGERNTDFVFSSLLPQEELRFFSSLTQHVTTKFMGLPATYMVSRDLVDQGIELISRLGIQIKRN